MKKQRNNLSLENLDSITESKAYFSAFPHFSHAQIKRILSKTRAMLEGKSMLTMGKAVQEFEQSFARYCGLRHGIATNSCTSALNVVFRALGLGRSSDSTRHAAQAHSITNKAVLVPTQTFFANASSVLNCGADLVLVECDKDFMLSLDILQEALKTTESRRIKAVVLVHFAGLISKDIFAIKSLCKKRGITLIEDCSHAHGAQAMDKQGKIHRAGSIGDIGVFSFFSTKILPCGEGGMIVCNDEALARKCRALANRGLDASAPKEAGESFIALGENYRLGEFNAILGCEGLEALESNLTYRNKLAAAYKRALAPLYKRGIVSFQEIPLGFYHSYWRFIVFLHKHDVSAVLAYLKARNIYADAPYKPLLHKQPLLESLQSRAPDSTMSKPDARALHSRLDSRLDATLDSNARVHFIPHTPQTPQNHISLPLHCALKLKDITYITHILKEALHEKA
ncbi:DegT/DnrJ/EryC1/StrS family aminotransferase [Helicobacter jaachi]|uniref:DegT/DnrJ/EryC1/StrS family aminotransferase n=1 Tax=Helicobacter jaachi TaxID=1677920 RepID=A0A4U8TCP9_9HELI|nr:DegT/DnrJ/EryC1/StrS family aminotransferase [Helicobacter jaachi]TLD97739.1 DegT/DnrJ/EryC1/StrS family aminotransferase [Helicobacter jaachi]